MTDTPQQPQDSSNQYWIGLVLALLTTAALYFGYTITKSTPTPLPTPTPTVTATPTPVPTATATPGPLTLLSSGFEKPAPENKYAPALSATVNLTLATNEKSGFIAKAQGTGCAPMSNAYELRAITTTRPSSTVAKVGLHYDPLIAVNQVCAGKWYWLDVTSSWAALGLTVNVTRANWDIKTQAQPTPLYIGVGVGDVMAQHNIPASAGVAQIMPVLKTYLAVLRDSGVEAEGTMVANPPIKADGTLDLDQWSGVGSFRDSVMTDAIYPVCMRSPAFIGQGWATAAELAAWEKTIAKEPGLAGVWAYFTDEPTDLVGTAARAQLIRNNAPHLKTMVTHEPTAALIGLVDYFTPVFEYFKQPGHWQDYTQAPNYWMYGSCMSHGSCSNGLVGTLTGTPDIMLDEPTVNARAFPVVAYSLGASGALYYDATYSFSSGGFAQKGGRDPWVDQLAFGGDGDGTLVYPCVQSVRPECQVEGATPSLRLKMIGIGMNDNKWAKHTGKKLPVVTQFNWSKLHADYEAIRL